MKLGIPYQTALVVGVLMVAALALTLVWFHYFLIYRFGQTPGTAEEVGMANLTTASFVSEDGHETRVWLVAPIDDAPVIVYFAGNFTSTVASVKRLIPFAKLGYGIAVLQYRGSGGAGGRPSERMFAADARALYDQLDTLVGRTIPSNRRILHGFSLGSGVAITLATERHVTAVVLESPFASLTDFFAQKYFGFPMNWVMWAERYDSIARVGRLSAPILLIRGSLDTAIPQYSFDRLAAAAPKTSVVKTFPKGGHSDLANYGATAEILGFYRRVISGAP